MIIKDYRDLKIMKLSFYILNILFFSKRKIFKPSPKKILIINGDFSDIIAKNFNKSEIDVVYNRFPRKIERDAEINLYVVFYNFFRLKFSTSEYVKTYINFCKPKLLVTLIDNDPFFYKLKKIYPQIKTISIQNSLRSPQGDIFDRINELKKKDYKCDFVLVYNNFFGNYYKKFLKTKIVQIGSFRSNQVKLSNKSRKKFDILFVSNYKGRDGNEIFLKKYDITWGEALVQEERILSYLLKLKILIPNLRIGILGCKEKGLDKEKEYFKNHLKGIKYEFIPQSKSRKTYNIIDKAELMLAIDSSLIYETLARGNKVCVFGNRSKKYPLNTSRFAWPANVKNEGFFWSSKNNFKTFHKIVLRCLNISSIRYFKKYKKDFYNSLSIYDYKNKKFKETTRNLLRKNEKIY